MKAPQLYPQLQNRNKCAHLDYSFYTRELNFGQIIWDKTKVLLRTSLVTDLGTWEPFKNLMGTKRKKPKNPSPHSPRKGKNKAHHECMLSLPIGYIKFL
jgi:hypothetical protein